MVTVYIGDKLENLFNKDLKVRVLTNLMSEMTNIHSLDENDDWFKSNSYKFIMDKLTNAKLERQLEIEKILGMLEGRDSTKPYYVDFNTGNISYEVIK